MDPQSLQNLAARDVAMNRSTAQQASKPLNPVLREYLASMKWSSVDTLRALKDEWTRGSNLPNETKGDLARRLYRQVIRKIESLAKEITYAKNPGNKVSATVISAMDEEMREAVEFSKRLEFWTLHK